MKKIISCFLFSFFLNCNSQNCNLIVPTDTFFCQEGISLIKANGAISYTWSANGQLTCTDSGYVHESTFPYYYWHGITTITVTAKTPNCTKTVSVIIVQIIDCTALDIPEIFQSNQIPIYYDLSGKKIDKRVNTIMVETRGNIRRKVYIRNE